MELLCRHYTKTPKMLTREVSMTLDKCKGEVPLHAMKAYGGVEL